MKISSFILGAAAGAAAVWFLDPNEGARRRSQAAGQAQGAVQQVKRSGGTGEDPAERLGDTGLRDKVESEIFRAAGVDKSKVVVSVEDGVVYLRGELESRDEAEELARAAGAVDGVRDVENMLHEPGQPAPMKQ